MSVDVQQRLEQEEEEEEEEEEEHASSPSLTAPPPPLLLQQIPDVILEIASHLPTETALCLALTCKPLYALLFHRTNRRLLRRERHLFLFTLLRDLSCSGGGGYDSDRRHHSSSSASSSSYHDHHYNYNYNYYCHTCSKVCVWRCPYENPRCGSLGGAACSAAAAAARRDLLHHREFNGARHACITRGLFTTRIPELDMDAPPGSRVLHTDRTGWRNCCEYAKHKLPLQQTRYHERERERATGPGDLR